MQKYNILLTIREIKKRITNLPTSLQLTFLDSFKGGIGAVPQRKEVATETRKRNRQVTIKVPMVFHPLGVKHSIT
jgi:hypothetical protein